jgi:hypothetical protein
MRVYGKKLGAKLELKIIAGVFLFLIPFSLLGRMDLALPSVISAAMICYAVSLRWRLRRFWWFWVAVAMVVGLHVYLILRVPWGKERIASLLYVLPFALVDFGLILGFFKLIEIVYLERDERPTAD